jgi:hypothetical protein
MSTIIEIKKETADFKNNYKTQELEDFVSQLQTLSLSPDFASAQLYFFAVNQK